MLYKEIYASIFDVSAQVIVHQVNCMGVMGSGVAKQVKDRFPSVLIEYQKFVKTQEHNCLGDCLIVDSRKPGLRIANLFGQYYYRGFKSNDVYTINDLWKQTDDLRFTNYEAFWRGLVDLRNKLLPQEQVIAFPYKIGCDRGGADWNVISEMIKAVFKETDKEILICRI